MHTFNTRLVSNSVCGGKWGKALNGWSGRHRDERAFGFEREDIREDYVDRFDTST